MTDVLLVLNTGSSSLKFEVFGYEALDKLAKGKVTGIGTEARLSATVVASDVHVDRALAANDHETAMAAVIDLIDRYDDAWRMVATVHRIVHGGADFVDARGQLRFPQTLMLYDIAAIQSLYGADMSTRTGNTVYGFHATAGGVYDFAKNPSPVVCIWDAGGRDTLDFSGFRSATRIDLREGAYSNTPAMTKNVSIAFGAVIENAVGGTANDTILGNSARNALKGGNGNDRLEGAGGNDALKGGGGRDRLVGATGNDTLDGGSGRDTFIFNAAPGRVNADRINGFKATDDVIHLERTLFKGIARADGVTLKDGQFHASKSGKAHDKSDRILYDTTDGKLYWDRDGSRSGHDREHFATLKGHPSIDAADFLIV